jgi:hypothetical protein
MKIAAKTLAFQPDAQSDLSRRVIEEGLRQLAKRVDHVDAAGSLKLELANVVVEMPISLGRVADGYYTESAAAAFFANRLFKQLLPHLPKDARQEDIVGRGVTYGSDLGQHDNISVQELRDLRLTPKWSMEIDGVRYHVSDPIRMGSRVTYVAWVEQGAAVHLRVFYTSQSQGVWRAASHRQVFGGWIGKGYGEQSTDLPLPLMEQLSGRSEDVRSDIDPKEGNRIFYGLLEVGDHHPEQPGFYPAEQRDLASFSQSVYDPKGNEHGKPETFTWNDPTDAPNFGTVLKTYTTTLLAYGTVTAYWFPSKNGSLRYLFYQHQDGRCWMGSVEDMTSSITERGARREVALPGDLALPLYEYSDQIPVDYVGGTNPLNRHYFDAWEYVKRLPYMADLYREMGWEMPGGVPQAAAATVPTPQPVPLRSRQFAPGDACRVARSDGSISPGRVRSITGGVASVAVYVGGQVGNKPVPVGNLLPFYQAGEGINVPRSSGGSTPGAIQNALENDRYFCVFVDPSTGGNAEKPVSGTRLDQVN